METVAYAQTSNLALTKDVVATLAKVESDDLSRILSKFLGLETMLAIGVADLSADVPVAILVKWGWERDLSVSVFEASLFPRLEEILTNDVTEFFPYTFQLLALINPKCPALVRLLQPFLQNAPNEIKQGDRLTKLITATIEMKLTAVASTRLICESPILLILLLLSLGVRWWTTLSLVSRPEQDRADVETGVPYITENMGYTATFVRLYNAGKK
ncbi:hypothetical protein Fmac_007198 [Flemingia macrophylla]|uniref:Exportin-2 C-terminal domain-containing protein n=1 Tax=Flemingia macrophylla TaxID=520843 RepID=A0ABD1NCR7_9FABA